MASKKLRRTGVSADLCEQLKRHQVETCQGVLSISPVELMRLAGLSYPAALDLLQLVSEACVPAVSTAWKKRELCFSTSLPALDRLLHGGLPRGALTEVTGPSGCGKTQLCIMLSVLATLPRSMGEMAQARFPEFFSVKERLLEMASRVHLFRELTCQDVLNRKEFDTSLPGNLTFRSNLLGQEAAVLMYLSQEFCIPVVLTNQITTHVGEKVHCPQWNQADVSTEEDSGFVTAALIVQYEDTERRQIVIAKSPMAPFAVLSYTVQKEGIRIEDSADSADDGDIFSSRPADKVSCDSQTRYAESFNGRPVAISLPVPVPKGGKLSFLPKKLLPPLQNRKLWRKKEKCSRKNQSRES